MRNTIICALLLWSAAAFAQNLNPTVEVTNIYAREASGIEKPSQLLEIPDSLTRFNLDFDYAVNETPYQGAYEFTPYLVEPRPSGRASTERKLYLRVGAGYPLHPEFAAVWTPVKTQKFRLNIFGDHNSYMGTYVGDWQGKDLRSRVGADMLLNWRRGILQMDVQYNNVFAQESDVSRNHHRVLAFARVQNVPGTTRVDYDVNTRVSYLTTPFGFNELHTLTNAQVGGRRFRLSASAQTLSQQGGTAASFSLSPRFILGRDRFSLQLGVKLAYVLRSENTFVPSAGGYVFPDILLSWAIVPSYLTLFASVTGGNELVSYDFLLSQTSFIDSYAWSSDVKRVNVAPVVGFRGHIGYRFSYEVKGGYSWMGNSWLWGQTATQGKVLCYGGPIHSAFVDVEGGWKNQFLDIKASLRYAKTLNRPTVITEGAQPFLPAEWSGNAHVFYNWGSRIRAGVTLAGRSRMNCPMGGYVPGFLDLGFQASYQFSRAVGIWLKLGNLLNQSVQRVPFYAEKGLYFTAGFTFNL